MKVYKRKIEYPILPIKNNSGNIITDINESIEEVNNEKLKLIKLISLNEYKLTKFYELQSKNNLLVKQKKENNKENKENKESNNKLNINKEKTKLRPLSVENEIKKKYSSLTNSYHKNKISKSKISKNMTLDSSNIKTSFIKLTKNNFSNNKLFQSKTFKILPITKSRNKNNKFFETKYSSLINIQMNKRINELSNNENHSKNNIKNYTLYNSISSLNSFLTVNNTVNEISKNIKNKIEKERKQNKHYGLKHYKTINEQLSMINLLKEKKNNKKCSSYNFQINDLKKRKVLGQYNYLSSSPPIQIYKLRNILAEKLGLSVKSEDNEFKFQKIFKLDTAYKTPKWVINLRKNHKKEIKNILDLQNKIIGNLKMIMKK